MEEKIEKKKNSKKWIVLIIASALVIIGCGGYLFHSYYMVNKYNVDSFKLGKYTLPTFNSALKSKKKLLVAIEEKDKITLKYDITKAKLNDVYAYLEKLSAEGFVVVNLEDTYIRTIHRENNIQIRIKTSTNHLIFEYNIGIDESEPTTDEKAKQEEKKEKNENTSEVEEKKE